MVSFPEVITKRIQKHLRPHDVLKSRGISRSWNNSFNDRDISKKFVYVVDGTTKSTLYNSLQTLVDSTTRFRNFFFKIMDLEEEFLGNETAFKLFIKTFGINMECLMLQNCFLPFRRFVQLLSYCDKLTELRIANCPTLFWTGIEILFMMKYFRPFVQRFTRLETLAIREDSMLTNKALQTLLVKTKNLRSLIIETSNEDGVAFPKESVISGIKNNIKTLQHLVISILGNKVDVSNPDFWHLFTKHGSLEENNLLTLRVTNVNLGCTSFNMVLTNLILLRELVLESVEVKPICFANVKRLLHSLQVISLNDSLIWPGTLKKLAGLMYLSTIKLVNNTCKSETENAIYELYRDVFFAKTESELHWITLKCDSAGLLLSTITAKCGQLEGLDMSGCSGLKGYQLQNLRMVGSTLKSLKLRGCDGLDDNVFGNADFIKSLTALEDADLSETDIGIFTVREFMYKVRKLKTLVVEKINVMPKENKYLDCLFAAESGAQFLEWLAETNKME